MDREIPHTPTEIDLDPKLAGFFSEAQRGIPPHERSMIYNEVRTIEQRYGEHVEIAEGGLKHIYKVYDRKTGRHVAFACLRNPERKELYDPFLREARLTGALHHPNIIPVYDLGLDENGEPFFIMELKSGKTLAQIIRERRQGNSQAWSLDDLLGSFLKICEAMAYAHSRNILHLDLKPGNIQVGEFGEVMICDWGMAKIISTSDDVCTEYMEAASNPDLVNAITQNGLVKGTPGYMAPEQVSSGGKKNYATDIYGLGAILYYILTGKTPIEGDVAEVLEKTREGRIPPPSDVNPHISKALGAVAMKAMRLDPELRYQCVEELISDIQKYNEGFATTAESAGLLKLMRLLYLRRRTHFLTVAAILLGFSSLSMFYLFKLSISRKIAVQERNRAQQALQRIVEEQRVSDSLRGTIQQVSIRSANEFWHLQFQGPSPRQARALFGLTLDELNRALEHDPTNQLARVKKEMLLFVMQRFNEAVECFEHDDIFQTPIRPLCSKYSKLKSDVVMLSHEQFVKLSGELMAIQENRAGNVEMMLLYDFAISRGGVPHVNKVMAVLKLWNPEWTEPIIKYTKRKDQLVLGGDGLRMFALKGYWSSGENLLRTIRLRRLVFEETDFSDLKQLVRLPIAALDISRTQISSVNGIRSMRNLHELIIREGQFSEEERKQIPQGITVKTVP
jgi:serine/threonine protein kinase